MSTYLFINDEQKGPFTNDQIQEMLKAGQVTVETLFWRDGFSEWQRLANIRSELEGHFSTSPQLPPPLPQPLPPALIKSRSETKQSGGLKLLVLLLGMVFLGFLGLIVFLALLAPSEQKNKNAKHPPANETAVSSELSLPVNVAETPAKSEVAAAIPVPTASPSSTPTPAPVEVKARPDPGTALYVVKRFHVRTEDGLQGFSEGKKVSFIREEAEDYVVSDGTIEGKASKDSFTTDAALAEKRKIQQASAAQNVQGTLDLVVASLIVKRVPTTGVFGGKNLKFRYFFALQNKTGTDFDGTVEIVLNNKSRQSVARDIFTGSVPSGQQRQFYIDASLGPPPHNYEYSLSNFTYVVKSSDKQIAQGEGEISAKFEDLSE